MASTTSMVFVPGCRWTARTTARSSLNQLATLSVCTPSITRADLFQPHRRAVAIGDDERPVGGGVHELAGRLHVHRLVGAVERARRLVDVGAAMACSTSSMPMPARGQRARVDLHAHRVLLRAEDRDLRHAADRRDALREVRLRVLVHRVERQRGRAERQVETGWSAGLTFW